MGRRKGEKIMKIPAEFEDILRGVELTEREKRFLRWITSWDDHTMQNMRTVVEKVRSTLSTLQAENETLRAELKSKVDLVFQQAKISIHAPREGCDSKLYQRAESLLGSICLFAQGEEG